MGRRQIKKWTAAEWIRFGNRVKKVRAELIRMCHDVQDVCPIKNLSGLVRVQNQLDNWKSKMEDVVGESVPAAIFTRIFYGCELPENLCDSDRPREQE
jgi:hypothetical protein